MSSELMLWAQEASALEHVAGRWERSAFVPKSMQGKPEEILGAILAGRELGLDPMAALRGIDIIEGTPAMRAHTMMGLVLGAGHEVWVEEANSHRAVIKGRRKGSNIVQETIWTMERAKQAGLASKQNWVRHPQPMLVARGQAEMCRRIAPDVLIGMAYTVDELVDEPDLAQRVVAEVGPEATKPRTRKLKREPLPSAPEKEEQHALPASALEEQKQAEENGWPEVAETGAMTEAQRATISAGMQALNYTSASQQRDFLSRVLERQVTGTLTVEDAEKVIDVLIAEGSGVQCDPDYDPDANS